MTVAPTEPGRTLADLIAHDAPVPVRRAGAVMLAVARAVQRAATGALIGDLGAHQVTVHADGSVDLDPAAMKARSPAWAAAADVAAGDGPGPSGAAMGRLLFELLVGRAPLGREDAFEPAITEALAPEVCALLSRSFGDAEGQWPAVDEWVVALERIAGGQAAPLPPAVIARDRSRRTLLALALSLLAAISLGAVLMAPTWWDAANRTPTHQGG